MIEHGTAERDLLLRQCAGEKNAEARASIGAALNTRCGQMRGFASGILAASAENPHLLEPVRQAIREQWQDIKATSDDLDAAMLAWLAIEGLSSMEMHDLSPLSGADRERVIAAVHRLLAGELLQ
jgi:hypothetical protein